MIPVAVIGLSEIGLEHAQAYKNDPLSTLVAVCDADSQRAQSAADQLGVPAFSDVSQLLETASPDLCSVCGVHDREMLVGRLLASRVHVLAEPPIARTSSAAKTLAASAKRAGRVLASDFNLRFTPAVEQARQWVASDRIGTPLFINTNLWRDRPTEAIADPNALFLMLGCHGIDMVRQFSGEVRQVQCFGVRDTVSGLWSSAQVNMTCTSGLVASLTLSYDMVQHHPMARCEMAGSKARFVIDNVYEETTLYPHDEPIKLVMTNSIFGGIPQLSDTYARRIHALLQQIDSGDFTGDATGQDACTALAVMEAALRAAENESVEEVESGC